MYEEKLKKKRIAAALLPAPELRLSAETKDELVLSVKHPTTEVISTTIPTRIQAQERETVVMLGNVNSYRSPIVHVESPELDKEPFQIFLYLFLQVINIYVIREYSSPINFRFDSVLKQNNNFNELVIFYVSSI